MIVYSHKQVSLEFMEFEIFTPEKNPITHQVKTQCLSVHHSTLTRLPKETNAHIPRSVNHCPVTVITVFSLAWWAYGASVSLGWGKLIRIPWLATLKPSFSRPYGKVLYSDLSGAFCSLTGERGCRLGRLGHRMHSQRRQRHCQAAFEAVLQVTELSSPEWKACNPIANSTGRTCWDDNRPLSTTITLHIIRTWPLRPIHLELFPGKKHTRAHPRSKFTRQEMLCDCDVRQNPASQTWWNSRMSWWSVCGHWRYTSSSHFQHGWDGTGRMSE
jgi:hypothetical protein